MFHLSDSFKHAAISFAIMVGFSVLSMAADFAVHQLSSGSISVPVQVQIILISALTALASYARHRSEQQKSAPLIMPRG